MTDIRLNLGSGSLLFASPWINVDRAAISGHVGICFVQADLSAGLPFNDGCASMIYSSHFIEHLDPFDECEGFLGECFRVLSGHGVLRIAAPDFRKIAKLYLNGPQEFYAEYSYTKPWFPKARTWSRRLGISVMYGHKMLYDLQSLSEVLATAGFRTICEVEKGPGLATTELQSGIVTTHLGHTITVDAAKV